MLNMGTQQYPLPQNINKDVLGRGYAPSYDPRHMLNLFVFLCATEVRDKHWNVEWSSSWFKIFVKKPLISISTPCIRAKWIHPGSVCLPTHWPLTSIAVLELGSIMGWCLVQRIAIRRWTENHAREIHPLVSSSMANWANVGKKMGETQKWAGTVSLTRTPSAPP